MSDKIKVLTFVLITFQGLPFSAHAQVLEEVMVTAQKRTESLQDVPISVSALQGKRIDDAGIVDLSALSSYVPNLYISNASVTSRIYMRGAGSGDNQAFEQSVGMYIDGIYMSRGRQYRAPFMDLERIEVLRGPQGTLFGRNTVAGAISISTANPDVDEHFNGKVSTSVESHQGKIGEVVLSSGVSDSLAMRFAYKYTESDGFVANTFISDDEPQRKEQVLRFTTIWEPSESVRVNAKYSYADFKQVGSPSVTDRYLDETQRNTEVPNRDIFSNILYFVIDNEFPSLKNTSLSDFTTFKNNNREIKDGTNILGLNPDSSDTQVDNFSLTADVTIGDFTLTSTTGYSSYEFTDGVDADFMPITFIHRDDDQRFHQYSQEFRIASPVNGNVNYIAGLYIDKNELIFDRRVSIDTSVAGLIPKYLGAADVLSLVTGGAYGATQISRNHYYALDAYSYAGFIQTTFNMSDELRLSFGLRYANETKKVQSRQILGDSNTGLGVASDNPSLVALQGALFNSFVYDYNEKRGTSKWLPAFNIQWNVSGNTLLYTSVTKGFKSGGFTSSDDGPPALLNGEYDFNTPGDDFEFDDENVLSYEVGGKSRLLEGGMTANWAVFYTRYSDLQISSFRDVGYVITNASESVIKGLELDVQWQITDTLTFGSSFAYLNAQYTDYKDAPCTAVQLDRDVLCGQGASNTANDLSGRSTLFAPDVTAAIYFNYERVILDGMTFFIGNDINYRSGYETAGDLDPEDSADAYVKLNIRIGVTGRNDNWGVQFYGRNISDEQSKSIGFDTPGLSGSHSSYIDEAATYGVRAQFKF